MDERESHQRMPSGGRQAAISRIVCEIADAESWERLALLTERGGSRDGCYRGLGDDAA